MCGKKEKKPEEKLDPERPHDVNLTRKDKEDVIQSTDFID
jgi:hypothetical protein